MGSKDSSTPMDPTAAEGINPGIVVSSKRQCYALTTLVIEFQNLFPETVYDVTGYNGRNVGLDAIFDLTGLDTDMRRPVTDLLRLTRTDDRVAEVLEDEEQVIVQFHNSPRIYDSREPFNLGAAWLILGEQ